MNKCTNVYTEGHGSVEIYGSVKGSTLTETAYPG